MKHILILLSFFLLSSPVIGDNHKGETLYGWGNTLPYVWKGFGDKETHPKYQGQVKDGKPNGLGIFIDRFGTKRIGNWKDGEMNGQGTETLPDGRKYVGEWKDNSKWNITFYLKNGNIVDRMENGKWIKQ